MKLLSEGVIEALNYRIQQEEFSSRLYEQMALWLNDRGLLNTSKLYSVYSQEELKHAQWAKDFLLDYGITPTLKKLDAPVNEYGSLKDIFEATLEHELEITRQCNELATMAFKEGNHVLYSLASKYCAEQHEEVGKAVTNLDILSNSSDMLIVDHYIGDL